MAYTETLTDVGFTHLCEAFVSDETQLASSLAKSAGLNAESRRDIHTVAAELTRGILEDAKTPDAVDAFLSEYTLASHEGRLLMRLAESLVRTPDSATANLLLRDKISAGMWHPHLSSKHSIVKVGTLALMAANGWISLSGGVEANSMFSKLGDRVMLGAVRGVFAQLGRHFVLGTSIERATSRANRLTDFGSTYSYDMLGEAAMTEADASRYFEAYAHTLQHLATTSDPTRSLHQAPALSVKLSALHPRYEYAQRDRCVPAITDRVLELCHLAQSANVGLTIDAEETERLEISLYVVEAILASETLRDWAGFGLAVQAYQRRATQTIDWVTQTARRHQKQITVRLVKGAYWDREIKRAQELGLDSYPVFTRKEHTDISYLTCARKLLDCNGSIYPQFATHNAHTAAAVLQMVGERRDLEFQRLHGMSDGLHRRLSQQYGFATRTYAPVGRHEDLLPYLVRRLLENGANSSFVNQVAAAHGDVAALIEDPIASAERHGFSPHPAIPDPCHRPSQGRKVAAGQDLTQSGVVASLDHVPAPPIQSSRPANSSGSDILAAIQACKTSNWPKQDPTARADALRRAADILERDRTDLMAICVHEARKTWPDAEAELRESVDFLRYYADQSERPEIGTRTPLGPVACISPWNFPLAIFLGQVSAALSVGNTVIAKPAEQTPLIALEAAKRLFEAGVPKDALHLIFGDGTIGRELVETAKINAVCFTGSTGTAKRIARSLAETRRGDIPLIAETGGINAMLVDSTALLEQAVKDVVASAFQSAGQRCSACRLVCVQEGVADQFIEMLSGAMDELRTDDPSQLSSDLGAIIDGPARTRIEDHVLAFRKRFKVIGAAPPPALSDAPYLSPIAFEIAQTSDLKDEVFGPVLHLMRYKADNFERTIEQVNALGFGLTMGLHSRIDQRASKLIQLATVGNLYINRNQIGAIVGEQPFGGEGLSGTGPKAGGPNYLKRLSAPPDRQANAAPFEPVTLPGPTGESNTLSYVPRGALLCLGGDDEADITAQRVRVSETGNRVIELGDDPLSTALNNPALKGVVADGRIRPLIASMLARRAGPILPLLSRRDDVERYFLERVVSIDTTAAGGNASLLADV